MGTLFVVRHADAGPRAPGEDRDRPLSDRGARQAERLAERLGDSGARRLVSSPFVRCRQTLEPLGRLIQVPVETDLRLAEGQGFAGPLELADELRGAPAVVCSHGDVIPELLNALVRRGMELTDEPRWSKSSTWVLTRSDEGFAHARYIPPPT